MDLQESLDIYNAYIEEHRRNVALAFDRLFCPYFNATNSESQALASIDADELKEALKIAERLCKDHDLSKYEPDEFDAYRRHFCPSDEERLQTESGDYDDEAEFDRAWHLHVKRNPHHPPHWADENWKPLHDIPLPYVIEAICDWEAMAMKFGGTTLEWWETRAGKEHACMTSDSIALVDQMLAVLFNVE